jgi:hypothetical protein
MSHGRDPKLVPVYRLFQFTWDSPCFLGTPCSACQAYALEVGEQRSYQHRRGQSVCERATPAKPAFHVTRRQGLILVYAGLATLIHAANALQLTFSTVINLRDQSSKADEQLIFQFLAGSHRARKAIIEAWSAPPPSVNKSCPSGPIYPFV